MLVGKLINTEFFRVMSCRQTIHEACKGLFWIEGLHFFSLPFSLSPLKAD